MAELVGAAPPLPDAVAGVVPDAAAGGVPDPVGDPDELGAFEATGCQRLECGAAEGILSRTRATLCLLQSKCLCEVGICAILPETVVSSSLESRGAADAGCVGARGVKVSFKDAIAFRNMTYKAHPTAAAAGWTQPMIQGVIPAVVLGVAGDAEDASWALTARVAPRAKRTMNLLNASIFGMRTRGNGPGVGIGSNFQIPGGVIFGQPMFGLVVFQSLEDNLQIK